jgi:hypothetical protein
MNFVYMFENRQRAIRIVFLAIIQHGQGRGASEASGVTVHAWKHLYNLNRQRAKRD